MVPYFGALIIRILLFRVLYWGLLALPQAGLGVSSGGGSREASRLGVLGFSGSGHSFAGVWGVGLTTLLCRERS